MLEQQDRLMVSKSFKAAIEQRSDRMAKPGLKGEPHVIPCDVLSLWVNTNYLTVGGSQKVTLFRTSNDLGHGDGRGRWVYTYLKNHWKAMPRIYKK